MVELSLRHDGQWWVADSGSWTARGQTLEDLDRAVATTAREAREAEAGQPLVVRMTFDNAVIPQWMRQYSQHYFNRLVTLDVPPEESAASGGRGGPCQPT